MLCLYRNSVLSRCYTPNSETFFITMTISRGFMPVNIDNGHYLVWSILCAHNFTDSKCQPLYYSLDPLRSVDIPTIYFYRNQHNVRLLSAVLSSALITQSNWYNGTSHFQHQWGILFDSLNCNCFQ
jgi:hypothetical protein